MSHKDLRQEMGDLALDLFGNQVYTIQQDLQRNRKSAEEKEGSWHFIANTTQRVLSSLLDLRNNLMKNKNWSGYRATYTQPVRFLDAGCGIGNILVLAAVTNMFTECHGLEYFPRTLNAGKRFLKQYTREGMYGRYRTPVFKIMKADILKFNNYGDYDVIYYFCPFSAPALETRFEERLEDQMKVGAVVLPFMKNSRTLLKDDRFKRISIYNSEGAWMKVKGGERTVSTDEYEGHFGDADRAAVTKKYGRVILHERTIER